jgi:hypothetical protein
MKVKKYLTTREYAQLVADLTAAEYYRDDETGEELYRPGYADIIRDVTIVKYYTNCSLPVDITEAYEIVCALELIDHIELVLLDSAQYNGLKTSIKKAQKAYHEERVGFAGVWNMVKGFIDNFDAESVIEKLRDVIAGITPEQMTLLGNALQATDLFNGANTDKNAFADLMGKVFDGMPEENKGKDNIIPFPIPVDADA